MAFGTGLHAGTRLALGFIEKICAGAPPDCALEVGTGTGILTLAETTALVAEGGATLNLAEELRRVGETGGL